MMVHSVSSVNAQVESAAGLLTCGTTNSARNAAPCGKGYDWTVIGMFDNSADRDRYQISPVHREMKAFMVPHLADIVVCDFGAPGDR
jgi:hypothetical protein